VRRGGFFLVLLAIGGGYWLWDSTHHDHSEAHGPPLMVAQVQQLAQGTFVDDSGQSSTVTAISCRPGENGAGVEPNVHFSCDMTFADGETVTRLVHVLEQELIFKN
jgi:hypothetical protein